MRVNKIPNPNTTAGVVIIGGGVIGLTIARALAHHGVREIMLIERGQLGTEASWAAGGILAPQVEAGRADDFFQLACASRDLYPEFADALREETGVDIELDMAGTLCLGFSPRDEVELRHRYVWQRGEGLQVDWLSADEARRQEPGISANVSCALRFPRDFQVENRRLVQALVRANERLGIQLVTGCSVLALRRSQGKVFSVETSNGLVDTANVIVAAGAWSSQIVSPDISLIRIEPVRGQMLCFQSSIAKHVIYSSHGYLVPRRDGRVLAGSTAEQAGFDKSVTDEGVGAIKSMAFQIVPSLTNLPIVDSWAGFRPRAKDGLPVIGPCEETEGLFYATGHYRNGILLAPITGKLIAEALVDGSVPAGMRAFSPNRFGLI